MIFSHLNIILKQILLHSTTHIPSHEKIKKILKVVCKKKILVSRRFTRSSR